MIKARFSKAIKTYDKYAIAQSMIIENLLGYIDKEKRYSNILEIGAGSGNLTKEIVKLKYDALYVNDICPEIADVVLKKINQLDNISYLIGDAEVLDFKQKVGGEFDLVVSSSVFQWFKDLQSFFNKIYSSLNNNGELIFSSFIKGNLKEVNEVTGVGLEYLQLEDIISILEGIGFSIVVSRAESIELKFDTPLDVLKHIKLTGVNSISSQRWTSGVLDRFIKEYTNKFSVDGGVVLTYTPIYIKAIKKIG